jgi:hypothetical protein
MLGGRPHRGGLLLASKTLQRTGTLIEEPKIIHFSASQD